MKVGMLNVGTELADVMRRRNTWEAMLGNPQLMADGKLLNLKGI